jgi:hypothetical protein
MEHFNKFYHDNMASDGSGADISLGGEGEQ